MAKEKTDVAAAKEVSGNVEATTPPAAPPQATPPGQSPVRVDNSSLKSSYCNVCSGTSTREEVVLQFGVNQDWDLGPQVREIQMHHRIILSPYAAKRLQDLVTKLVQDHEARYGVLKSG